MRWSRRALTFLTVVAAMLLPIAQVQYDIAVLDIVWRTSALSWDSPSTQLLDEMASQPVPAGDPVPGLNPRPIDASQPLLLITQEPPPGPGLPGPVTRAPPSV